MIRRAAFLLVAVFAVLVQMAAGFMGPESRICVCSACIAIEGSDADCRPSAIEARDVGALVVVGERGCTDCHVIPLPDTTYVPAASAPAPLIPADIALTRIVPSKVVWSSLEATRPLFAHRQRTPPNQQLRNLRTVVITC